MARTCPNNFIWKNPKRRLTCYSAKKDKPQPPQHHRETSRQEKDQQEKSKEQNFVSEKLKRYLAVSEAAVLGYFFYSACFFYSTGF